MRRHAPRGHRGLPQQPDSLTKPGPSMTIPIDPGLPEQRRRTRRAWRFMRWLVPMLLVLLFLAVLIWLPWQARQMESTERQEQLIADTLWVEQTLRFELARSEEALSALGADLVVAPMAQAKLQARFTQMFKPRGIIGPTASIGVAKKFLHFRKAGKAQYLTKAHEGRTLNACAFCHFRDC